MKIKWITGIALSVVVLLSGCSGGGAGEATGTSSSSSSVNSSSASSISSSSNSSSSTSGSSSSSSATPTYSIGGSITGLTGKGLVLVNNGVDDYSVTLPTFAFTTKLASGTAYNVLVATQPSNPDQVCVVDNGTGIVGAVDVTNVTVSCATVAALTLSGVSPIDGAVNVSRTINPTLNFSANLDAGTVTGSTVSLRSLTSFQNIAATATVSGNQVTVVPSRELMPLTTYTLSVSIAVRGSGGETLVDAVSTRFTTQDGSWGAPILIGTGSKSADSPQIAFDGGGNAFAVWAQQDDVGSDFSIWVNRYARGSTWGTATMIERNSGGLASAPQISVNASGNAFAIWAQRTSNYSDIWASRYLLGVGWRPATLLETDNIHAAESPQIAIDSGGNALALWGQANSIWSNRYSATGGWGAAVSIQADSAYSTYPQLVFDNSGNAIAIWGSPSTGGNIQSNYYTAGTGWNTSTLLETTPNGDYEPQIAVDAIGNAWAAWTHASIDFTGSYIWTSRYVAGSGWSVPNQIDTPPGDSIISPQIAVDASGNALVVWYQISDTTKSLMANRYTLGNGWGTAVELYGALSANVFNHKVAVDASGNAWVVWAQQVNGLMGVWVNRYSVSSGWGIPEVISDTSRGGAGIPDIGIDASGNASVIWVQAEGFIDPIESILVRRFE